MASSEEGTGGDGPAEQPPEPLPVRIEHERVPRWIWRSIVIFWMGWIVVYLGTGAVRALRSLLIVLLVSLFLSFAIEPAVNRMERWGLRRGVGTWIMFLAVLAVIGGFSAAVGTALATQLTEFIDEAPGYIDDIESASTQGDA